MGRESMFRPRAGMLSRPIGCGMMDHVSGWPRKHGTRRVTAGDAVVFESAWVSVRYQARENAGWLAGLIDALAERGAFPG
jgi:hypothetical protein